MNVSYRGIKKELSPKLQEKLDAKFAKISKLVEKRGEKEAHVVVTSENRMHKAEITMQMYGHPLVGIASDPDLFTALNGALDKLDKQAVKNGEKWRAKVRRSSDKESANGAGELVGVVATSDGSKTAQRVYRVNHLDQRKPMTLEEALLEMGKEDDYVVYRDADKECVSVLVRRRDGHFDLIES
ncbi:MAG TPA: ribosome-associated translation inhibitor RaiA [Bryobacteraceae bacterium]|jgi:putative sigma-54 modulation protein|nr:ribosome-associated translation inhibitor RaiA [Bryobacteraceae bacterium]